MSTLEKVAYLKGLVDGLEVGSDTKEGKIFAAIIDALDSLAAEVDALGENAFDIADEIDAISSDLSDVEAVLFGDDCDCDCDDDDEGGCDCGCCGDEIDYAVDCPSCSETIEVDEEMLVSGSIVCPKCGEKLEFDYDEETEE